MIRDTCPSYLQHGSFDDLLAWLEQQGATELKEAVVACHLREVGEADDALLVQLADSESEVNRLTHKVEDLQDEVVSLEDKIKLLLKDKMSFKGELEALMRKW